MDFALSSDGAMISAGRFVSLISPAVKCHFCDSTAPLAHMVGGVLAAVNADNIVLKLSEVLRGVSRACLVVMVDVLRFWFIGVSL